MLKKMTAISLLCLTLAACAASQPRIVQTSSSATEVRLSAGIATQIELPEGDRVQSVIVGKPSMVTAEPTGNVVNLVTKEGSGETNIIIRATDEDSKAKTYQYRLIVQVQ